MKTYKTSSMGIDTNKFLKIILGTIMSLGIEETFK